MASTTPREDERRGVLRVSGATQILRFEPHTLFDDGDKAFVLIAFDASVQGKNYSFPNNGHLWQFNAAGKVVKYDHITDTGQFA